MPDDNQTVTEPRSAVEAASSQGHGGTNTVRLPAGTYHNPDGSTMTIVDQAKQTSARNYADYLQAQAAQSGVDNLNASPPAAPTVKSGISRLRGIRDEAEKLIGEFEGFVGEMEGNPPLNSSGPKGMPAQAGTAGAIHDAANDLKFVFNRLADLVKRAKAAHG